MLEISFVKEFSGNDKFESIHNLISTEEIPEKKQILQYLKSFEPDCAAGMPLTDEITGKDMASGVEGYEDGKYYWDTRHIYHFESYNLKLNDEFISHVLKKYNWATPSIKEYPFWRDDMSAAEYDREREYYQKNFEDLVMTGKYIPLWKQSMERDDNE